MTRFVYKPIGVLRTPHTDPAATPVQPAYARGVAGRAELEERYAEGLRDLSSFSHVVLLYHLHRAESARLTVVPYLDDAPRGVFATRAPHRPNPIGLSIVRLVRIVGTRIDLEDVDMLDGTPLLDIKPYVPRFDPCDDVRCGWLDGVDEETAVNRGRRAFPGKRKRGGG